LTVARVSAFSKIHDFPPPCDVRSSSSDDNAHRTDWFAWSLADLAEQVARDESIDRLIVHPGLKRCRQTRQHLYRQYP
jgi:hypothetical protein